MTRQIECECGYVARGESDDQIVDQVHDHIRTDHPELLEAVTRDEIAGWIEVVE
jgi:predicted small metal-binding protein